MHQSEHDKVAEKIREEEREKLIALYTEIAISNSEEYGFLNVRGHEVPDPTVIEPPLGYVPQPDLMEQMRAMVRNELSRIAEANEHETFEEADDFEIEDDPVQLQSVWSNDFEPSVQELIEAGRESLAKRSAPDSPPSPQATPPVPPPDGPPSGVKPQ